jgi:galactoside O-acetyltransferase
MAKDLDNQYLTEADLLGRGIRSVGTNVRIAINATVTGLANVSIGSNVRIDGGAVILARRGNLEIGNNVHIEPLSSIICHHPVYIGNFCTISHGVRLFTESADYSGKSFTNQFPSPEFSNPKQGSILIHDHVIIGGNSVVMPGCTISQGAAIGALSFVRHDVPAWEIWAGNPLRLLGKRQDDIKHTAAKLKTLEGEHVDD